MTIYTLEVLFFKFWASQLSMYRSNWYFFTHIEFSQEEGKVVWYSHLFKNFPQFVVIYTIKCFSVVNEAEVDVFLEFPCFFCDPMEFGNLITLNDLFLIILGAVWTSSDIHLRFLVSVPVLWLNSALITTQFAVNLSIISL